MKKIEQAIKERHNKIRKLLHQIEDTTERASERRPQLLLDLKKELIAHARAEEIAVFPKLEETKDYEIQMITTRSTEEHRIFENIIADMEGTSPNDLLWSARFQILQENLESYMRRLEKRLLPLTDALLTNQQSNHMLNRLQREESDVRASFL